MPGSPDVRKRCLGSSTAVTEGSQEKTPSKSGAPMRYEALINSLTDLVLEGREPPLPTSNHPEVRQLGQPRSVEAGSPVQLPKSWPFFCNEAWDCKPPALN